MRKRICRIRQCIIAFHMQICINYKNMKPTKPKSATTGAFPQAGVDWPGCMTAILETAPHRVILVDAGGIIDRSNAAPEEEAFQAGVRLSDTLPDLWAHVKRQLSGKPQPNETTLHMDGNTFRAWVVPLYEPDHEPVALCVIENHSELEKMVSQMQAFKEFNEELDAIINSSDDGLWVCDARGKVLRINAASERMNMVHAADVIGRSMEELVEEGLIDRSVTIEVIQKRCRQNIIQRTRSGRKLVLTGTPVFNNAGQIARGGGQRTGHHRNRHPVPRTR